jgi:hypothetical protein
MGITRDGRTLYRICLILASEQPRTRDVSNRGASEGSSLGILFLIPPGLMHSTSPYDTQSIEGGS